MPKNTAGCLSPSCRRCYRTKIMSGEFAAACHHHQIDFGRIIGRVINDEVKVETLVFQLLVMTLVSEILDTDIVGIPTVNLTVSLQMGYSPGALNSAANADTGSKASARTRATSFIMFFMFCFSFPYIFRVLSHSEANRRAVRTIPTTTFDFENKASHALGGNVTACGLCFEPQFEKRCIIDIDLLFKHLRETAIPLFSSDSAPYALRQPAFKTLPTIFFFPSLGHSCVCLYHNARFSEINMKYGKHDENRKNVQNFSTIN